MSSRKRKLRVKFQNNIGTKLEEILGTSEVFFEVEETKDLYKKLSVHEDIEDWDWEEEKSVMEGTITPITNLERVSIPSPLNTGPVIKTISDVMNFLKISNYLELALFIKAVWTNSSTSETYTPAIIDPLVKTYNTLKNVDTRSFDMLGVKTYLENEYKGDFEKCKDETAEKINSRWTGMKSQQTYLTAFTELFKMI